MRASNPLEIRTAVVQIETAILEALRLAYFYRYPESQTLSELSQRDAFKLLAGSLMFVVTEGVCYRWEPASLLPVLSPYVVAPVALGDAGNGRWIRESSSLTLGHDFRRPLHTVRTGYAKYVGVYQGEDDEMLERLYGQAPAFLLEWTRNDLESVGMRHGMVYEFDVSFVVHVLSRNLRDGADAAIGTDVPADAGTTPAPGLHRMLGDVQYLLAGSRLGLEPGVKFASIDGAAQIVETDLAQRWFRAELPLTVRASVHLMDEDLFDDPEVWVARKDAGTAGHDPIDLSNYVAEGLRFAPAPGLTGTPSPGVSYVGGQLVISAPPPHTFPASSDSYRDLRPDGSLAYRSVPNGSEPPPVTSGAMRIGVTVTDQTRIVADSYLCDFVVPSGADPGDPFRVI